MPDTSSALIAVVNVNRLISVSVNLLLNQFFGSLVVVLF